MDGLFLILSGLARAVPFAAVTLLLGFFPNGRRSAGRLAAVAFGALIFWLRAGVVAFDYDLGWPPTLYLAASILIFGLGEGLPSVPRGQLHVVQGGETRVGVTVVMLLIGIAGGALLVADTLLGLGGLQAARQSSLHDIRTAYNTRMAEVGSVSAMGRIGSVLYGAILPGFVLAARAFLVKGKLRRRLLLATCTASALIAMTAVSMSSGGRQSVLTILLVPFAVWWVLPSAQLNRRRMRLLLVTYLAVAVLAVSYFRAVTIGRAEGGGQNEAYLLTVFSGAIRPEFADWYYDLPSSTQTFIVAAHCYYPYNLVSFGVIYDYFHEELGWGRFQGEHILRQLRKFGIVQDPWGPDLSGVAHHFTGLINWPTVFGAMIIDFGRWGGMLVSGVLGLLVGLVSDERRRGDLGSVAVRAVATLMILHSTMYSPFLETLLLYGLIWAVMIRFVKPSWN